MVIPPQQISALLDAASRHSRMSLTADSWAPTVQGAVGHVIGVRVAADGLPCVLKFYDHNAPERAAREIAVLQLLQNQRPVPVPQVVSHGRTAEGDGVSYLLMTRIAGVRWADRRRELDAGASLALHRRVGQLLRRLHVLTAPWFGDVLESDQRHDTAWAQVRQRCERLVEEHLRGGGHAETGRRVRRLVERHRSAFDTCDHAALCHHDFIDSNLIVDAEGEPRVRGVVDWERASWSDPIADLAQVKRHTRFHGPPASEVLVDAYGIHDDAEARRLLVHEVLHTLDERMWINDDRPAGWEQSVAALDAFILEST